jgi:hypothetical protein
MPLSGTWRSSFSDQIASDRRPCVEECASFIAELPGVDDVPFDGGEMIPVCGHITLEALREAVEEWWRQRLG